MKTKIYIAVHKKVKMLEAKGYYPIQVGAAFNSDLGYIKDSDGEDNISEKNPNFCELTALYYLWKNEKNCDYIGLTHYRRYFFSSVLSFIMKKVVSTKKIEKYLEKYDIILPTPRYFEGKTVREHFEYNHPIEPLEECKKIISEDFPDYLSAFEQVETAKYLYPYNMFIMSKQNFDDYMKWLFAILFKLESYLDMSQYDAYNKRMYGFLSERLLDVWVIKNNYRIKEMAVFNTELSRKNQIVDELKRKKYD